MVERVLLAAGTWERIEGKGVRLGQYVLGVDLGGSGGNDSTVAIFYWPASGLLLARAAFPWYA